VRLNPAPLIARAQIDARIVELAAQINGDYAGRDLVVIVVLKGAMPFAADLIRALEGPLHVDFVRAKSYAGTDTTGEVRLSLLPEFALAARDVLVVEDILDTGHTATALLDRLGAQGPASLRLCTLLDKPARRRVPIAAHYAGFTIDDHFVVGYGLDLDERYRELPAIHTLA
jgi:hypoxanthine phosphoribosyltransferase